MSSATNIDPLPLLTGDIGTTETPWHAHFPKPTVEPDFLPSDEVLAELKDDERKKNVLLVDLRRNDHDGKTISPSLNLPAQSLYTSIPTLVDLAVASNKSRIVFYCGQSLGRGYRAAAWTKEYIEKKGLEGKVGSYALEGGIKGWVKKAEGEGREEYRELVVKTDGAEGWE